MEVTNLLATHQPQLSVMVCSYNQDKTRNQLCYVSDVLIAYQATGKFYLDQASFNNMLAISTNNAIQFEFNDTYSNSLIHWHCSENRSTQVLKPTALVHMVVTATQINILSYSCTVTQS